ncbi:M28 family metallopeptidase [Longimicrobium terrae]|uniref:Carboxypeptidase Q n=1 Tax=Longimicrobium terrae TaxID=1639882 RepID=A0A841H433_9BACT|nr:M28 family metallopeptidase [Longimicrobium terrae]MBB4638602.1 carboxypeptidase Q [Longimicrobium terrae]MBB6072760.1 carboxypeptidase Q [Longimicrobium terrae]NNC30622.1 M20/M25/M40 family metallo-hydrolase [Longimicrobium terrae]
MRNRPLYLALAAGVICAAPLAAQGESLTTRYQARADSLIRGATRDSTAWNRMAELVDRFGPRFSGTPELEQAIDWVVARMREDGLENVHTEPVMVPRWVRGQESATLTSPRSMELHMLGLGGSVGTAAEGVEAEVMVVGSFDELTRRASEARGKIVLFDVPFTTYGQTQPYRGRGAIEAARVGAVASLIRSLGPFGMQSPHTGGMRYNDSIAKIPAAALSMEDAMLIHRLIDRGERPRVRLRMGAQTLADVPSRNVVAEIRGSELPNEVVVMGGHIDSWDVAPGAMDDAGGCVAAWEALRVMKRLGMRPRRTVRVVLWTNEENGTRGGTAYRDAHRAELPNHILAIESDEGVFAPKGFSVTATEPAVAQVRQIAALLRSIGADSVELGGGGADIGPIMQQGVPGMGLMVEQEKYFWYHHTSADTPDKLDPVDIARSVAAMAVMSYVAADAPVRIAFGRPPAN